MKGSPERSIKAVVVEDEVKLGTYISSKIEIMEPLISVVGMAGDGRSALELIEKHHPQVVFTDISMPVMDGLELARRIKYSYPGMVVVIISGYSDFAYAQQAIQYGVFNYLLKPVEDEKLSDVLYDLRKSLAHSYSKQERQVLYSDAYMFRETADVEYAVFAVCVGNLIYDMQDEILTGYYREKMEGISWKEIMEELCGSEFCWYLADEQPVNQKLAGIQVKKGMEVQIPETAQRLCDKIREQTGLSIHICCPPKAVEYDNVWSTVKYLRYRIQQELVIGHTQILFAGKEESQAQNVMEIVKMKLRSYIQKYFRTMDLKDFMDELQTVLKYMIQNRTTQTDTEKVCLYILKLLEFSEEYYDGEFLETMKLRLQRGIGLAASEQELLDCMMGCFREINGYMEWVCERNAEERVLEYVDTHFLTLESLEQVADVLGYNYTYLSRMFKKITNMSASKYITNKKIALAKELLERHPDMLLDDICGMCGYHDTSYFSRVFKKCTGVSPGEYRAEML